MILTYALTAAQIEPLRYETVAEKEHLPELPYPRIMVWSYPGLSETASFASDGDARAVLALMVGDEKPTPGGGYDLTPEGSTGSLIVAAEGFADGEAYNINVHVTCTHRIYSNPDRPSDQGRACGKPAAQVFTQPNGSTSHFCERHHRSA